MFGHLRLLPWPTKDRFECANSILGTDIASASKYSGASSVPNHLLGRSMRIPFKGAREFFYIYAYVRHRAKAQSKQAAQFVHCRIRELSYLVETTP